MDILVTVAIGAILIIALAVVLVPPEVDYEERILVAAPAPEIYDHIRYQSRLMQWSAWPSETGSDCGVEGSDGALGAKTIYLDRKGNRFGEQEVTRLEQDRLVELTLTSKGPPQRPVVTFRLEPVDQQSTRVILHFTNLIARPFNLLLRVAGIVRWTRAMHVKDLEGLKRFAEPPHTGYAGTPAQGLPRAA
ncbi:SRPBCC family protein [Qipengyuania qiaonensis]|uniref:SRPBCC family protein n=1 Tax=Qipengyuania qiaonensis TaxID=2867240 RepID=A0ABS7J352_9SPHN|nr:SRPBCC family protein [Qipengyuania qiaonensis]